MTNVRAWGCLLALALSGCAGTPPASEQAALAEVAQAPAEHVDDVTNPTNVDEDKVMAAQTAGYRIVRENGQTLYCKRQQQTGSRVRDKTMCLTKQEWERLAGSTRQTLDDIARQRPPRQSN